MKNNLNQWLDFISHIHPKEMDFGLERLFSFVEPLKLNRFQCPVISVGGTNGKGSTVCFLETIYTKGGYRVGAFTSPHLVIFNERIRIGNKIVTDNDLIEAFQWVEDRRNGLSLTFFEYTFVAALYLYQKANLDLLILEVGLGGRLDAVNVVDADVAIITTVDLDHTDILGPDRESIGREKAGIFREGRSVICGDPEPPFSLRCAASELEVQWYALEETFHYKSPSENSSWCWWNSTTSHENLPPLSLKMQNAAISVMAVEIMRKRLPLSDAALREGLAMAKLNGRFEKVNIGKAIGYLDVAHNPQSSKWLAEQWAKVPVRGRRLAIVGMLADKDIARTLRPLLNYVDVWYVVSLTTSRGTSFQRLLSILASQGSRQVYGFEVMEHAIDFVLGSANLVDDVILVFGSFYTVGAVMQCLSQSRFNVLCDQIDDGNLTKEKICET